ncbi:MAG: hypothetical protein ACWGOL_00100 [Desulfuromonadales bacterium]
MYSMQHLKFHSDFFASSFRGIAHFLRDAKYFFTDLLVSFEKAKEVSRTFARDPYNQEEIKRIMFEK